MKQSLKTQDGTRPMQQSLWAGSRNDPVSRTALPGSDKAKMMTATSGLKCLESFEKFNRPGLLAKTFPALLIGQKGWYSRKCNLIWKLKATKSNRLYFQLQVSVPRTEEIESGLWPTPTSVQRDHPERVEKLKATGAATMMSRAAGENRPNSIMDMAMFVGLIPTPDCSDRRSDKSSQWGLSNYARNGLLPTPRANEVNGCNLNSESLASRGKGNLEETVAQWVVGMLPTPATRDYKGARSSEALQASGRNGTNSLPDAFAQTGKTSQLNHRFVMEMMGFPPTWCDIYYELAEIAIQKKRRKKKQKG